MNGRRRLRYLPLGCALAVLLVAASTGPGAYAKPTAAKQQIVLAYSDPVASEPALRSISYGMRSAIKQLHLGWKVLDADAGFSSNRQVAQIDSFINQKVQGITSWTLDSGASEGVYSRARKAGIPVILYNSPSKFANTAIKNETDSTCNVAKAQAAYIAKRIPHARVLALAGPAFVPSIDFTNKCFFAAAKKDGLTILDKRSNSGNGDQTLESQNLMNDMLVSHPSYDAAWAYADTSALGVSAAILSNGGKIWSGYGPRNGGVILISRDGNAAGIQAIKKGRMTVTFDPHYEQSGAAAVEVFKLYLADKKPLSSLPKAVTIKATVWDIKNAGAYKDQLHRKVILPPIKH